MCAKVNEASSLQALVHAAIIATGCLSGTFVPLLQRAVPVNVFTFAVLFPQALRGGAVERSVAKGGQVRVQEVSDDSAVYVA